MAIKVFSLPKQVPAPEVDYANYDHTQVAVDEDDHKEKLKAFLVKAGYDGNHTGRIYRAPAGDGYAQYMVADGKPFGLVHLPYGDAWQSRDVGFLTKTEVIRRIDADEKFQSLFRK